MHNFVHVKAGETLSYSFKFKNIGEGAIRLNHAEVSCDCLEVRLPERETAKDSIDYLEVIFHTAGEWG
ncbi:MAG: DUF1573 domain-containing protein, partial [Marinilabiliales bacterium]|nr:DUF1573 domain-containing protein [Marinilabiliales bacterium]